MESLLKILRKEFLTTLADSARNISRPYKFPQAAKLVKVAIGMRRSGKTHFLFQTIRELIAEGIPLERIFYLNFQDERLLPMDCKSMGQLIDMLYTLHPANHRYRCYLFLDEVRNVEGWPLVVRRVMDTKNIQIYVTVSSTLLNKEIHTSLRARSLRIEILPYSYSEYLYTHQLEIPDASLGRRSLDRQRSYLIDYFKRGGFPEVQSLPLHLLRETLQNYAQVVVLKDVVECHQIKNIALLKHLTRCLLKGVSSSFSINKFYNELKSQGQKASKDTLYTYLTYLEDAFLIFTVPFFTDSLRLAQRLPKKVYAIDNGLVIANSFHLSDRLDRLLKNQLYLDLRREGKQIFYYRTQDGYEIDFITQNLEGNHEIIQVSWETEDPLTREREERALEQAHKELGFPTRLIDWKIYLNRLFSPLAA